MPLWGHHERILYTLPEAEKQPTEIFTPISEAGSSPNPRFVSSILGSVDWKLLLVVVMKQAQVPKIQKCSIDSKFLLYTSQIMKNR